jgi:hypothetical protein
MWDGEQQVPPLRYASVGMTILFWLESISRRGPLNCRSLGFARDDKGEGGDFIEVCDVGW